MATQDLEAQFAPRPLSPAQKSARWHFAQRGAVGALIAALLLEVVFALMGAGQYFHQNKAAVVLFHHAQEKVSRQNLGTGDIQLTLDWKGTSDLDLHCDDPSGQRIYFGQRRSRSGGRLDFDMNAGAAPWSSDSIENIFWPFGAAPVGEYVVYVHAYRRHDGPADTPFRLRVLHRGKVDWVTGVARFQTPRDTNLSDPVNPLAPQEVFRFRIETPPSTAVGSRSVDWVGVGTVALWLALVGLGLVAAILGGLNRWYAARPGPPLATPEESQRVIARSLLWGAAYGAVAQTAFALLAASASLGVFLEAWRLAAWAVLAMWLGARAGHLIPAHLEPSDGRRGGLLGGLASGVLFWVLIDNLQPAILPEADLPGRLLGALLIGACIGWQVIVPEPEPPRVFAEQPVAAEPIALASLPEPEVVEPPIIEPVAPEPEPELEPVQVLAPVAFAPEPTVIEKSPALPPVPMLELRVTRSRGGRRINGRAMGGPRRHSGGRAAHPDSSDE